MQASLIFRYDPAISYPNQISHRLNKMGVARASPPSALEQRKPALCGAARVPLATITGGMDAIVDAQGHSCRLHQQAPESTLTILHTRGT